ncbi:MAG: MarR family transcriptional regulator [Firmicutes bacterium]|nr:MarR family transcriptional regulator [Bacillota bacterium]
MSIDCIIGKINLISSVADSYIKKRIKEEKLPILRSHIPLFYILPENGEGMLFSELKERWQISKSSLSDIINRYESHKLINKCQCSEDKRSIILSLTKEAIDIKIKLEEIEEEFLDLLLVDFEKEERKNFEDSLNKALNNSKKIL